MTTVDPPSLEQQRQDVRERLQAQRRLIAELVPVAQRQDVYPRSMLMRVLISRPELVASVVAFIFSRLMRRRRPPPPSAPI